MITYRKEIHKSADILIISLVHQGKDMINYMIENIEKYVRGSYIWIVHYNGKDDLNENNLPDWVWLNRNPIKTDRHTRTLSLALTENLNFALKYFDFINVMTLSSGSAFFRNFNVPKIETVSLESHEQIFNPNKKLNHISPIPIKYGANISEYLKSLGGGAWQYEIGDKDVDFHKLVKNRNFEYYKGCQWSGQIWPKKVAEMLAEDIPKLKNSVANNYTSEEIYFSTYAYNYAFKNNLKSNLCEVIINWEYYYQICDINYIKLLREKLTYGSALCKLSDNTNDNVRIFINN